MTAEDCGPLRMAAKESPQCPYGEVTRRERRGLGTRFALAAALPAPLALADSAHALLAATLELRQLLVKIAASSPAARTPVRPLAWRRGDERLYGELIPALLVYAEDLDRDLFIFANVVLYGFDVFVGDLRDVH